jgi:hypothetical protein
VGCSSSSISSKNSRILFYTPRRVTMAMAPTVEEQFELLEMLFNERIAEVRLEMRAKLDMRMETLAGSVVHNYTLVQKMLAKVETARTHNLKLRIEVDALQVKVQQLQVKFDRLALRVRTIEQ